MPRTPRWVGAKTIKEDPSSGDYSINGDSETYTLLYNGSVTALRAAKPARGAVVPGYTGFTVVDVKIKVLGAGLEGPGQMTVTLERENSGGISGGEDDQVTVEIDAGRLDKSIYQHKRFKDLSREQIANMQKVIENKETVPGPTFPGPVVEAVQKLYDRLARQQEGYFIASPTVRKVTTSVNKPTVGKIGIGTRTTDKPHPSAPDGYVWIKSADRATQTGRKGKWERTEVWDAADDWDEYIYGPQPGD